MSALKAVISHLLSIEQVESCSVRSSLFNSLYPHVITFVSSLYSGQVVIVYSVWRTMQYWKGPVILVNYMEVISCQMECQNMQHE